LAATLALLSAETASAAPGAEEVVGRVADALLAQALRVALAELQSSDGAGVLALRDPQVAAAIERIYHRPGHAWTVGELAAEVALSRSPMPPPSPKTPPVRSARGSATHPEELPLGLGWRHGGRPLVGGRRLAASAEPAKQIGAGGVNE
jgi:hypothetical protein